MRGQVKRVVFDSDWFVAGVTNYAYWCTGMNALTEVHGFEECSGCANVTQTSTSYNRLESICATSFDNSSITSYTSVLYGCNRLVGGTGYVPTSTAGKNNLALGSNGVLTNPTNDSRTWVWAHFYDTGALEITATRTPDVQRTVLATGRICSNAHYQAVGATPWYEQRSSLRVQGRSGLGGTCEHRLLVLLEYHAHSSDGLEQREWAGVAALCLQCLFRVGHA